MIVWRLAWSSALARRRLFAWNVVVPALLLVPVVLSEAAAPHRTAVFGVFFVFFATFGSAIPTVRDASRGWLDRVFRTGYSRPAWFAESVLAGTALDLVQLAPVTLVLVVAGAAAGVDELVRLVLALVLALGAANAIGLLLAAAVRSLAEAALVSAAASLGLLHLAGFFRPPAPGWTAEIAAWMPYRPLREGLAEVQTESSLAFVAPWLPAVLAGAALVLGAAALAGAWTRRFEWPHE